MYHNFTTVWGRTLALIIIACCSITQTPTGQWKVWWWQNGRDLYIYVVVIQSTVKSRHYKRIMTMTMTMKIILLPCNTYGVHSDNTTLKGYIQQSVMEIWKEYYMAKGTRSSNLHVPISQHSNVGAIATVQVQRYQLSFYRICLTCYCKFQEVKKINGHSYYTNRQTHLAKLTWKISMLVELQFDKSSFEIRSRARQSFLNVPIAASRFRYVKE